MNIREQVTKAELAVDQLFTDAPNPPPGATLESLWAEILQLKKLIRKPKVQTAIKLLLEDEELAGLPIPLIGNIVKAGFEKRGFTCNCSESSIRWYISQKTMEWNIVRRSDPKVI